MRYAVDMPPFGPFADARLLAELAHEAEDAGWDGFFLWDHVVWATFPIADPWIALTAMAMRTERMTLGTMVTPLPRRRPTKVARETATLDQLTGGRLVLGVGIGNSDREWRCLGEETDLRRRGAMLDEGLETLTRLWSGEPTRYAGAHYVVEGEPDAESGEARGVVFEPTPAQRPRPPIWVAGVWPNTAPFRRAARWDGVVPLHTDTTFRGMMAPEQVGELVAFLRQERGEAAGPFAVTHWGITGGEERARDAETVARYAAVGVNWWRENISPWRFGWDWQGPWPVEAMRERIRRGPPRG